ncbi:unnamed protein product [Pseudo-nitzschia multistriata]|uniref:Pre-mRNA-splicing factor 38 n=1 Tax=Pseudo-nitzschia multistriata TaxID=183589 RepID=A0A448ZH85_9STRA|nr:unnamed protein product [Pseudo-nitzschia multistriata]
MANVTDPLIKSIQGSDPQNLMEYITRQKIYDSRFWKEQCFGLTVADVMERAVETLTCVGGTYSGMGKPTKFLSLVLKLLQLQPDYELIRTFLEQTHFKYLRALGAFYLRLTGRPQDIYELLDPLYADYSKLKYRGVNEWKLVHLDEFVDELLTNSFCCGIAMPRLPARETLQEAGYLEEGPRRTALHDALTRAGGIKEYLRIKVDEEASARKSGINDAVNDSAFGGAISLWEKRYGKLKPIERGEDDENGNTNENLESTRDNEVVGGDNHETESERGTGQNNSEGRLGKRKAADTDADSVEAKKKKKKEKKKSSKYGSLFKSSAVDSSKNSNSMLPKDEEGTQSSKSVDQNSDEYWNELRSSLGMNPLKK